MGLYSNNNGVLTPIAGRGRAEYGASTIRTGTFKNPEVQANSYATKTITFDTPMPDADYELSFEKESNSLCYIEVVSKAEASFVVRFVRPYTGGTPIAENDSTWNYTAFKLYTDTEYNEVLERTDANSFGTIVPLTYNTDYVCPSDGYLSVVVPAGSVGTAIGVVNGEWFVEAQTDTAQSDVKFSCVFVKKGMTVKVTGTSATVSKANFVPLV